MILHIIAAKVCGPFALELVFSDGARKRLSAKPVLHRPMFEPLGSARYFARVRLDEECGTVVWPNGADLAPEALYALPALPATRRWTQSALAPKRSSK